MINKVFVHKLAMHKLGSCLLEKTLPIPIKLLSVGLGGCCQTLRCFGVSSSLATASPREFSPTCREVNIAEPTSGTRPFLPTFKYSQDPSRKPEWNGHSQTNPQIQLLQVGMTAESFLGQHKFSVGSSLDDIFENFNEVINLFTLRNSHEEHPFFFLSRLLEAVAEYRQGTGKMNPYHLWRSMLALLVTEMFGYAHTITESSSEGQKNRSDRHVRMAKIAEIASITQQIHKRIQESQDFPIPRNSNPMQRRQHVAELHNANKTATLVGDLLWAQICAHMAALKSQTVSELICEFLMDYCEGEFVFNQKSKNLEQFNTDSWFRKTQLGLGSIMGTTISSTLLFSGHPVHVRNSGYKLGVLLGLTYQAYSDIVFFQKEALDVPNWLDIGLLPVIQKIKNNPHLVSESPSEIFQQVRKDSAVLAEASKVLRILQEDTLSYIDDLSPYVASPIARDILQQSVISLSP